MDPAKLGQVIYCNLPKTLFKNLRSTITMGILGLLLTSTEAQGQIEPTQLLSVSRTGGQRETSFEIQVEQGTHLELMRRKQYYYDLYQSQHQGHTDHEIPV